MSRHDSDGAVLFVAVVFAAAVGYILGALATYIQMFRGGVGRSLDFDAAPRPDRDEQQEGPVADEERWQVDEQHPVDMAMEGWGEVAGYLIVRDVEDGLMSFVRDEWYIGSGRRR
ncbi:hypothetical protein [Candidatus Anaplasma sp. TIGMIC]|uniref:hypothetical protein n=1 Tax=Candidatus Anaplasma sp. TIGMIC TaxID=3020713 RepID=UPI00232BC884|nr:hypothetical protein [Candidatus Anaplasma sp. TIGMIC]MDB1135265.1 hypothetical protein [Candidatus Anaplasma sp. TIGMIC]